MSTSARPKLTNPLRPVARYRKGVAPLQGATQSDSDSDSNGDGDDPPDANDDGADEPLADLEEDAEEREEEEMRAAGKGKGRERAEAIKVQLKRVQVDERGVVRIDGREEVGRTAREMEVGQGEESEEEEESDDEEAKPKLKVPYVPKMPGADSDEEGSSEYETESEEELKPIYKPVFVSKRNRDTIAERDKELDPEVMEQKRLVELEQRKKEAHDLVAESILRELAEKEVEAVFPDVDDTDGIDPQLEFEAWKLRELMRIKRDKEAAYAREKEREEVEARRALPETLRLKEDLERAKKSRDEKPKGQQVFLQKYHHKGAFYTDLDVLKKHDYTAPSVSTNRNMESLPAAMQVRNFGKRSQSKYQHLAKEDTTKPDAGWAKKGTGFGGAPGQGAAGGCFNCGGPHLKRDCTQGAGTAGPSGTNGGAIGGQPGTSRDGGWGTRPPSSNRPADDRVPSRHDESDRFAPPPRRSNSRERTTDRSRDLSPRRSDDRDRDPSRRSGVGRDGDRDSSRRDMGSRGGGTDRPGDRYEPAEWEVRSRERQEGKERERERNRGAGGYRDSLRDDRGEERRERRRSRSRSGSPRRREQNREGEKRRRVD